MRNDAIPPEFASIGHLIWNVRMKNQNEFCSTCPRCKDYGHSDNSIPDRFTMKRQGKYGFPIGFCRRCDYKWTPYKDRQPTDEEKEAWRLEQVRIETERKESAERALELLNNERIWEKFYNENNDWSYDILEKQRGFSRTWIKYFQFGLNSDFAVWTRDEEEWLEYHSPAISIPIWNAGGAVNEVKMRVLNPKSSADRYRAWYKTRTTSLYHPLHDTSIQNKVLVVEGEFKAAKVRTAIDDLRISVVGVQSKRPDPQVFTDLKNCEVVYLGLDPDCFEQETVNGKVMENPVEYCSRIIGKDRVRVVEFPCKPDDGIVNYQMDIMRYVNMARKAF